MVPDISLFAVMLVWGGLTTAGLALLAFAQYRRREERTVETQSNTDDTQWRYSASQFDD